MQSQNYNEIVSQTYKPQKKVLNIWFSNKINLYDLGIWLFTNFPLVIEIKEK